MHDDIDKYMDRFKLKYQRRHEARILFLQTTRAQRTPVELYALWLYVWCKQGGKIRHHNDHPYVEPAYVAPPDARAGSISFGGATFHGTSATAGQNALDQPLDYTSNAWNRWMPTTGGARIPAGYGAGSMEIFILPDFVDVPLTPATDDHRDGWEWGHTYVFVLRREGRKLVASTNELHVVVSYPDVDTLLRDRSHMRQLEAEFLRRAGGESLPAAAPKSVTTGLRKLIRRSTPSQ